VSPLLWQEREPSVVIEWVSSTVVDRELNRRSSGRITGRQALKMPMLISTRDHVATPYSVPDSCVVSVFKAGVHVRYGLHVMSLGDMAVRMGMRMILTTQTLDVESR